MANPPIHLTIHNEKTQSHATRLHLFDELADQMNRSVITFLTSFHRQGDMNDKDVEMLENVLRNQDLSKGLAILISSPGGMGLSAERMIRVLRTYSGTGEYWAIVPGKAKSAATMVCLGASKILMGPASELGPIDPQMYHEGGYVSVHHAIDSYHNLFEAAVGGDGHLEPYMQQLAKFDATEISHLENERDLAADIAVRCLRTGMLSEMEPEKIKSEMKIFLNPKISKTHGRPIFREEAKACGLNVEFCDHNSEDWNLIYELYVRSHECVGPATPKMIESKWASARVQAIHQPS